MNQKKNKATKSNSKFSTEKNAEDFNTGSHSPKSVRKVNAGYDDTGKGNNSKAGNKK